VGWKPSWIGKETSARRAGLSRIILI
jgi:hypothetical protein